MATPVWPAGLPLGIKYGATVKIDGNGNKVVTDMEQGPKRRRQRYTGQPYFIEGEMSFNDFQYERFMQFWTYEIHNGTASFIAPVLVGSIITPVRVAFDMEELAPVADSFNYWTIPFVVEVRANPAANAGVSWFWETYGNTGVYAADKLQKIVNVDYPKVTDLTDLPIP